MGRWRGGEGEIEDRHGGGIEKREIDRGVGDIERQI